ncbi:hypothetical protein ACHAXR_001625 [Thalassiosira sp. AJA248-18]
MTTSSTLLSTLAIAGFIAIATAPVINALIVNPTITRRHQRNAWRSSSSSSLGSSVINEIDSFYQTFPYASAFITCGIKASAADIVAQKNEVIQQEGDHDDAFTSMMPITVEDEGLQIDARRNFSFIMYGGLYQGIAQLIIYNQIFPLIFGNGTDVATVMSKVAFDNMFISPLICLPVAYLVKSVVFQFTLEEARSRYFQDVMDGLVFKYWCFWVPAQSLTFSVIPPHLRILFVAAVSFFWLVVFSSISSNANDAETAAEKES